MGIVSKTTTTMKNRRNGRVPPGTQAACQDRVPYPKQPASRPTPRLTRAVAAAWPDFQAFEVDDRRGTARGVIPTRNGYGSAAILGFTRETGLLRIDVKLDRPVQTGLLSLLELPFRTRWTRTMCARDDQIAWLRAASVCNDIANAGPAIRVLARDLRAALCSELLRLALGDDWAEDLLGQGGAV